MSYLTKKNVIGVIIVALFMIALLPVFSMADNKEIYVDRSYSGKEEGTSKKPFRSIDDAIDEAEYGDTIYIAAGTYDENIILPENVDLIGDNREEVVIDGGDDDKAVIKMKYKSKVSDVTVKGGKYGIKVDDGARVDITNVIVKENKHDGIKVESAEKKSKYEAIIHNSIIKDNGRSGIYVEGSRKISITENQIYYHNVDGIDLASGTEAWIYKNKIKNNDGSGMKLVLDGSEIWTKNNTIRDNEREGIEVNAYGGYGRIDVNKSKFYDNDHYGVARVQRGLFSSSVWDGFTFRGENIFVGNDHGEISSIITVK